MQQISLAHTGFELVSKRTRKWKFLDEMNLVIPWSELLSLIALAFPQISRLPDESTILRFRHMLEAHGLGQPILATVNAKLIDRGLMLKTGTVVDAKLITAPSSTKNDKGERDPEMHQTSCW